MYILLISFPLLGALVSLLFGNKIGGTGSVFVTTFLSVINFFISVLLFYEVALCQSFCYIKICTWFDVGFCIADWSGYFDSLTVVMLLMITFISMLVHIYIQLVIWKEILILYVLWHTYLYLLFL